MPKHRFQRLCPSLQDAALRYATPEDQIFLRQHRNILGPALIGGLIFGSCSAAVMGTAEGEARDGPFLQWVGSAGATVFSITLAAIFLLLGVSFFVWLTRT